MELLPERPDGIRKLPANLSPSADEAIPGPPSAGEASEWFPDDATTLVWSGSDIYRREMLTASLNENRIQCRSERTSSDNRIFVQPADESRAREIIREVCEASPPDA